MAFLTLSLSTRQVSLLFDTGKGYFACCRSISEAPRRKSGISAVTENAVAEIENRLRLDQAMEDENVPGFDLFLSFSPEEGNRIMLSSITVCDRFAWHLTAPMNW